MPPIFADLRQAEVLRANLAANLDTGTSGSRESSPSASREAEAVSRTSARAHALAHALAAAQHHLSSLLGCATATRKLSKQMVASRITFTTSLFLPPRLHFYALLVLQLHATREQRGGCQGHQGSEAAVHGPLIGVDRLCSLLGIQPLGIRARGRRRMRRRGGGSLSGGGRSRNSTHTRCEAAAWCPQHAMGYVPIHSSVKVAILHFLLSVCVRPSMDWWCVTTIADRL